ncbi:MAG: SpoIIIAH-like family protein [Defluviitaleaceae bacterium]|nr:SpoIIIAH-like family protein [Defluviitaleaceae bacterium]
MFTLKRNQIIITALVAMIAVAGYLSYTDTRDEPISGFVYNENDDILALVPDGSAFDQTVMVHAPAVTLRELTNAEVISDNMEIALVLENNLAAADEAQPGENQQQENREQTVQPGEAMFVSANIDSGTFFVQAKLDREQSRSRQKEILMDLINNPNIDQVTRSTTADAMLSIQRRIEKESATEALIEAKGFREVFVRIGDDTVDVVVSKEVLSDAEVAQIEDIIKAKTGMETEQIRISPMNRAQ